MHHKASPCPRHGCNPPSTERAVLALVLAEHPAQLTICEVAREVSQDEGDGVECAIRDLVGAGLLRCEGASVLPTRAALHFDRIRA